ncbi:MAG: hypothetical protein M3Q71_15310 [Chloroflexota bacterium]|nr:hypothetical protein [Chloroflexota bacterium]
MTSPETRINILERLWPKPRAGLTPAQDAELRAVVVRISAERDLDPAEVLEEAYQLISEGWTP